MSKRRHNYHVGGTIAKENGGHKLMGASQRKRREHTEIFANQTVGRAIFLPDPLLEQGSSLLQCDLLWTRLEACSNVKDRPFDSVTLKLYHEVIMVDIHHGCKGQ